MGYINQTGKFNDTTWLIDAIFKTIEGERVSGGMAAYLIKADDGSNCLINPSTLSGAQNIYRKLKKFGGWPLQKIIISHSHWDHTQGIKFFREKIKQENLPQIEILASKKAIPYLLDQSYNACFVLEEKHSAELPNIEGVIPIGEKVQLNPNYALDIIETPGHMADHISIYDPQTKTLFNGDAIGLHWFPQFYVCNSNSIYWKEKDYLESIKRIKNLDLEYLCIAHFGVFTGEEIVNFIDNSVSMYYKWMEFLDQNNEKLEDLNFLTDKLWKNYYQDFHDTPLLKETLVNSLIHVLRYYEGVKKT
jgi:glyoxylase-like metal-dependent hydrolase (beta-lactamase superfamily II)